MTEEAPPIPYILTIDLGTSSARAMLFDAQGHALRGLVAREVHAMHVRPDGAVEDDVSHVIERVASVLDQILALAGPRAAQIGAVAMDTFVSNVLGLNAAGQVVTPVYTYADTRPTPDVETLRNLLDEGAIYQRTGCRFHTSYLPARFLWLQRTDPDRFSSVQQWMSVGEYLVALFFGRTACTFSIASWTGLLDRKRLAWDAEVFAALPVRPEQFAPLVDANHAFRGLLPAWAERWPALRDVPWFPAIGDGAAANIGSGCTSAERVALTVGTSGAMRVILPGTPENVPDGLWCYRVDSRRSLLGGALSEGGNVVRWLRDTLQLDSPEDVERALQSMEPDAHGLTVLPHLAGERSPGWRPDARAAFTGLSLATRPVDIVQAMMEAVAYRFALVDQAICSAVPQTGEIIASGGGLTSSPAWMQIIADVIGRPVTASAEIESTSRGVALLALESLGILSDVGAVPLTMDCTYKPDAHRHARYQEGLARQQHLYAALRGNRL
ncbi:MAG: gluconokinase [Chloroflexi bacterium]|nr:gluconokinase [Chloroflexota bacterium]